MERLREFLHGVAGHGAGKYFAQLDGDNPVVLDGGHRSQSGVFLQLGNLLIQRGVAVVVDDDDFRGALHNAIRERGITKIALGHHFDDAVETFFLSLFYEGRISCFQPVTYLDRMGITQIRPMLYCGEWMLRKAAEREHLPVVFNPCPADGYTKRQEVKELIHSLSKEYPDLREKVFSAMQRLPLPAWEPQDHRRRPLADDGREE